MTAQLKKHKMTRPAEDAAKQWVIEKRYSERYSTWSPSCLFLPFITEEEAYVALSKKLRERPSSMFFYRVKRKVAQKNSPLGIGTSA